MVRLIASGDSKPLCPNHRPLYEPFLCPFLLYPDNPSRSHSTAQHSRAEQSLVFHVVFHLLDELLDGLLLLLGLVACREFPLVGVGRVAHTFHGVVVHIQAKCDTPVDSTVEQSGADHRRESTAETASNSQFNILAI